MPIFPQLDEDAIFLSQMDEDNPLSSYSAYSFHLDDADWPTVAHYFHAMKFEDKDYQAKIRSAESPQKVKKMGRNRLKKIRKDWKDVRVTMMTRAVYIKCRTHPEVTEALFETGDKTLVEDNNYDYFWGCGRDRRGENHYGKVLMNVRKKLRDELKEAEKAASQSPGEKD